MNRQTATACSDNWLSSDLLRFVAIFFQPIDDFSHSFKLIFSGARLFSGKSFGVIAGPDALTLLAIGSLIGSRSDFYSA